MEKIISKAKKEEYDNFINWLNQYIEINDELFDFKYELKELLN